MPKLTIYMASTGTPLLGGGRSIAGHIWYSIDDGSGSNAMSYGFGPSLTATGIEKMFGSGSVYISDTSRYLNSDPSKPIQSITFEISIHEFRSLQQFGDNPSSHGFNTFYNGLSNNCIDFVWQALHVA